MRIGEWLRAVGQLLRGRYECLLEEEIARLRAENLALLNSLLGTAGVPPLRVPPVATAFRLSHRDSPDKVTASRVESGKRPGESRPSQNPTAAESGTAPLRKRSWQQIGRMLEIEEARREREHAARVAEIRERWTAEGIAAQGEAQQQKHGRG